MAYCRNCGSQVADQAVVCVKCGVPPLSGTGFCQNCGAATYPNAVACTRCGASLGVMAAQPAYPSTYYPAPAYPPVPREPGASTMAIVSFVLSLVGLITCVTAIPGFIMGIIEIKKINRGESPQAGRGFALAAAIIGGILTGLFALYILFWIVIFIIGLAS